MSSDEISLKWTFKNESDFKKLEKLLRTDSDNEREHFWLIMYIYINVDTVYSYNIVSNSAEVQFFGPEESSFWPRLLFSRISLKKQKNWMNFESK